jgi:Na+/phosphate symporter
VDFQRYGSIVVVFVLIFGGAWTAQQEGDRVTGGMLMGAGLIMLGAWLASEVRKSIREENDAAEARRNKDEPPPKKGKGGPKS